MDIRSDGVYYYAHLRTALVDGNLDFYEELNYYSEHRHWVQEVWQRDTPTGKLGNFTQLGWALLCSPWFLLGRLITYGLSWSGSPVYLDGYEWPEIRLTVLGSSFYSFLAVLLAYRLSRYLFSKSVSFWATLAIWWGSGWIYYMLVRPSFSHGIAGFLITLLIFWSYRFLVLASPSRTQLVGLGVVLGLAALVRVQMILWGIIPLALLWRGSYRTWDMSVPERIYAFIRGSVWIGASCLVVFSPQMMEWRLVYGSWLTVPQGSDFLQFTIDRPFLLLFSGRHGLFPWAPVVGVALLGYGWLARRQGMRLFAILLLAGFAVQVVVNSAARDWWAGDAFGARRLLDAVAVWTLGLAALLDWVSRQKVPYLLARLLLTMLMLWNVGLVYHYEYIPIEELHWGEIRGRQVNILRRLADGPTVLLTQLSEGISQREASELRKLELIQQDSPPIFLQGWEHTNWSDAWSRGEVSSIALYQSEVVDRDMVIQFAPLACPQAPGTVQIFLNQREITRIEPCVEPEVRITLPEESWRQGANLIQFRYEKVIGPEGLSWEVGRTGVHSPYSIEACSGNWDDSEGGQIYIDRKLLSLRKAGINVVVLDPQSGSILTEHQAFDPQDSPGSFEAFLDTVASGSVVVVAVQGNAAGIDAQSWQLVGGSAQSLAWKQPYALIGVKGAPPGSAQEAVGVNTDTQTVCTSLGRHKLHGAVAIHSLRIVEPGQPVREVSTPSVQLSYGVNWRDAEPAWRWATSPATIEIVSSQPSSALLHITPVFLHDPMGAGGLGERGVLDVQIGDWFSTSVEVVAGQRVSIPVELHEGEQVVTLSLQAGNFRPSDFGGQDPSLLSFAVESIALELLAGE